MKRIDLKNTVCGYTPEILPLIAGGINEIMDYLEKNLPARNGKFWKCKNCEHVTAYTGEICCAEPDYELYTG